MAGSKVFFLLSSSLTFFVYSLFRGSLDHFRFFSLAERHGQARGRSTRHLFGSGTKRRAEVLGGENDPQYRKRSSSLLREVEVKQCVSKMHRLAGRRGHGVSVAWVGKRFRESNTFANYELGKSKTGGEFYWAAGVDFMFENFLNITAVHRIAAIREQCAEESLSPAGNEKDNRDTEEDDDTREIISARRRDLREEFSLIKEDATKNEQRAKKQLDCSLDLEIQSRESSWKEWRRHAETLDQRFDLIFVDALPEIVLSDFISLIDQGEDPSEKAKVYKSLLSKIAFLDFHHQGLVENPKSTGPEDREEQAKIESRVGKSKDEMAISFGFRQDLQFFQPDTAESRMPMWPHAQAYENLQRAPQQEPTKRRRGLILGKSCEKLGRSAEFGGDSTVKIIRALVKEGYELHSSADLTSCGAVTAGLSAREVANNLKAHGRLPVREYRKMLSTMDFVLGFGRPARSPTPLEAMAAGAAWITPCKTFSSATKDKKELCQYKVPNAPAPHMYTYIAGNEKSAMEAVRQAVAENLGHHPFVPEHMLLERVALTMCSTVTSFLKRKERKSY